MGIISLSATVCVMYECWYGLCECVQSVHTTFILQLCHYFWDGFFFFLLYFLSNSSMFICCPVLLGNEWKQYAKVWTISSWILNCGVCDEWWDMLPYIFQSLLYMQERLVEPGMGYDWAILVSLTKICMCWFGLGSCSITANSLT